MIFFCKKFAKISVQSEKIMNEECLLKYLLNPDELEDLTELLESITGEFQSVVE